MIYDFVGLAQSTYYDNINRKQNDNKGSNNPAGRPIPGYSYTLNGRKISDDQIKQLILELIAGDGFPYGYRKLAICLQEDYLIKINKKKAYRLCKELGILRPQRKLKKHHPRKLAKREEINNSNQLIQRSQQYIRSSPLGILQLKRVKKLGTIQEGLLGKVVTANRIRENRPSGMKGGGSGKRDLKAYLQQNQREHPMVRVA